MPSRIIAHIPHGLSLGAFVLAGLSSVGTVYMEYTHNDRDLIQRVSKLEEHKEDQNKQIDRIESQVNRLVEWALGHK